jgi:thioredoxin reductase (NADPH)
LGHLEALTLRETKTGTTTTVPAAALVVLIGAAPHTDWLPPSIRRDEHGFILTGADLPRAGDHAVDWPLRRPPLPLETSLPGVFAAGDVRHGSVKRVASGVGEGSIATTQIHQYLQEQAETP